MPWCPKCNVEYRPGFTTCADCGTELTDQKPQSDQPRHSTRRSRLSSGCLGAKILCVAFAVWIASGFIVWKKCTIALPNGEGSVVYMARLNKILCAEWDRKIRLETERFRGVERWIPDDPCGGFPVNVYWYPVSGKNGPYLRFHDAVWEYLVDLGQGQSFYVVRGSEHAYVAEITSAHSSGWTMSSGPDGTDIEVNGRPAKKLPTPIASAHGTYMGRIEHPTRRFIPASESPEEPILEH